MSKGYPEIKKVPLRKYPKSRHLDIYESKFASLEINRVFQASSVPELIRDKVLSEDLSKSLYYCFFLNHTKPKKDFIEILGQNLFVDFCKHGFIEGKVGGFRCLFRFVPAKMGIYVTSAFDRKLPNFTYLSYDSFIFARLLSGHITFKSKIASILDYCCGVGYVGLEIKRDNDFLLGIDVNPYAVWNSKLNAVLNGHKNSDFICKAEPPKDRYFDIIICNPPYIFLPLSESNKIDSYGGEYGLELTLRFLESLSKCLKIDSQCFMITRSPIISGEDYLLKILNEKFSYLCGEYFYLCDSLSDPSSHEERYGIEGYRQVFLKVFSKSNERQSGWIFHASEGDEKFRYAF